MKLAIHAGTVLTPLEEIRDCTVVIEDDRIAAVGREIHVSRETRRLDAPDKTCVPGFIDLHLHGAGGHDLMEGTPEALATVGRTMAAHGTTSYFPTTLTASVPKTLAALASLGEHVRHMCKPPTELVAHPLGIHMEGPFLNVVRKGVHPAQHIVAPAVELFDRFQEAAGGALRILTVAPEVPGAEPVIRCALERGVQVGMGHTDATFEQAGRAVELGVRHVIHMFNAMRPFSHRDPGIISAALLDGRLSAELIADGVHVHEPAIRLLVRAKGPERVLLITDGLAAVGMPEGTYQLGEFEIIVKGPMATNRDGVLAGSVLTLDRAVRNMVKFTGLPLKDVVRMATLNQALLLGLERKGRIAAGADADLVLLDRNLEVAAVCARGVWQEFPRGRP
jgi:N-acetylglucosamine-6-phosphate deacetylase